MSMIIDGMDQGTAVIFIIIYPSTCMHMYTTKTFYMYNL
jgi:hypothetical protein